MSEQIDIYQENITPKSAVLYFAKKYGKEEVYLNLIKEKGLLNAVEELVKELFMQKFDFYWCSDDDKDKYKIIYDYFCKQRNFKG